MDRKETSLQSQKAYSKGLTDASIILAATALSVLGLTAIIAVQFFNPLANNFQTVGEIVALLAPTILGLMNLLKIQRLRTHDDERREEVQQALQELQRLHQRVTQYDLLALTPPGEQLSEGKK